MKLGSVNRLIVEVAASLLCAFSILLIQVPAVGGELNSVGPSFSERPDYICKSVISNCPKPLIPHEWTDSERKQVVESLEQYPKWPLPKLWPSQDSKIFWLDDVRVLMSVRELPNGWRATENEKSKIVTLNTDTGQIEETPYRGDLVCYSPQRMILFNYPRPFLGYQNPIDANQSAHRYVTGKYGEELKAVEWPKKGYLLSSIGCQIAKRDAGTSRSVNVIPLLPGHGSIYSYGAGEDAGKRYWVNEQGARVLEFPTGAREPIEKSIYYLKWMDAYFMSDAISNPQQILYMNGAFQQLLTPRLLSKWSASFVGSGSSVMTRAGLLWYFRPMTGYYKKQGLYLEKGDSLIRVDDGEVVLRWALSPDGCRFFYGRVQGEYKKGRDDVSAIYQNYVIDLCKGNSK